MHATRRDLLLASLPGIPPLTMLHYRRVKESAREPTVIALFGIAPVELELVDPGRPAWRRL